MTRSDRAFFGRAARSTLAGAALALSACASHEPPRPPPPPPPPVAAAPAATSVYTVARGDTLSAIGRRYGIPPADLARMNGLADPHRLAPGQRLVVPAEPATPAAATTARTAGAPAKPRRVTPAPPPVSSRPPDAAPAPLALVAAPAQDDRAFVCVDAWIDEGQLYLRGARYEEAIESAQKARAANEQLGGEGATARTARLEILSASAEIALGRSTDAEASFTRALSADPSLRLDAATMSPKVVRAFEETRRSVIGSRGSGGTKFEGQVASDGSTTAAPASF